MCLVKHLYTGDFSDNRSPDTDFSFQLSLILNFTSYLEFEEIAEVVSTFQFFCSTVTHTICKI